MNGPLDARHPQPGVQEAARAAGVEWTPVLGEGMSDHAVPRFGPSGGRWTIANRIRCAILGHIIPPSVTSLGRATEVYLCARCNALAYFYDHESRRGFRSFDDWYDEIGRYRTSLSVRESLFGLKDGAA